MRLPSYLCRALSVFILLNGCKQPFSPNGTFEQKLVAYSVLTPQSDTQYVRLSLNYDPKGYDPHAPINDGTDTSAKVTVSGLDGTYSFSDTLIPSTDQSHFALVHAFVSRLFRPQASKEYTLTIVSPNYGTVSATSRVPGKGTLSIVDMSKLLYPEQFPNSNVDVDLVLDPGAKGFILRFVIIPALENDTTFTAETEVASTYVQNGSDGWVPVYGTLYRTTSLHTTISFSDQNYLRLTDDNLARYGRTVYRKWARFYLIQLDEGLYNYYSVVNGFQDPYSIRTDLPDYTNIRNGLGVFGSYNVDTLSIDLLKPVL